MTRNVIRNCSPGSVAPLVAILALLIAASVLAQVTGAPGTSGKANAVLGPLGAAASAQMARPLTPLTDGTGRFPVGPSLTKRHAASLDSNPPLFLSAVAFDSGGSGLASIAVGDVNGDGNLDLAVVNFNSNTVGVLLGNGDGTFQPVVTYNPGGKNPSSVAMADVNGDGKPDLVVGIFYAGRLGVLLGNGDGTFRPAVTFGSGGKEVADVAIADVNHDGKLDLIAANYGGGLGVLLGNGDGNFYRAKTYGGGSGPNSLKVADVNGDGNLDLLVANDIFNTVAVVLGNGDGTFNAAVTYGSGGYDALSVAVADVNGDGKADLVVANCGTNNCSDEEGLVAVLLGNGDGTFQAAAPYDSGGPEAFGVAVADVDGDGKPDVLAANLVSNTVGVLLGTGDGTFQPAMTYGSGGRIPHSVVVADMNGDGKPDLVVGNQCDAACFHGSVGVLLHNGSPTTTTLVSSLNPATPNKVVTYTATVTSQDGGAVTGSIMFQDGGSTIATVPLDSNQAAYSTTYTKGGSHEITAIYSGDAHNLGSTSTTLTEYVASISSKTVVTTSGSPSFVGQSVTFTATVTWASGTVPDGDLVAFFDGTTAIGTSATVNGVATFTTASLGAKTHHIKAKYLGDATLKPSSGMVTQIVNKNPTTTILTSNPNPSQFGQGVIFTAQVTSSGPTPTGKVRFFDGGTLIGANRLSNGVATFAKFNLAVGTHPITVQYNGDAASDRSVSSVVNQVVQ